MAKIWRVALEATFKSTIQIVNVLHVADKPIVSTDERTVHQMADLIDTWLATKWRACASPHTVLDDIKVTETRTSGGGGTPDQWVKDVGLAGTRAGADGLLSPAICLWTESKVSFAIRGNHGGWHAPPSFDQSDWTDDGLAVTSSTYWTSVGTFNDALAAGHDYTQGGFPAGTLDYVLYSQTRRDRGEDNWWFDVTALVRKRPMHWLRSRTTAP